MREIKFRAWDEKEKCWVGGFAIHQSGMFSDWAGCKKINGQCVADADWKYQHEIPHIKIVQYTGLKDKNGKEIYEGDILDVDGTPWLVEPIGTEERDGGKFGLCASPYGSGEAYFIDKSILDGKVIGNIYESPELLKGDGNA